MQSTERYNQYKDTLDIDRIYLLIKRGESERSCLQMDPKTIRENPDNDRKYLESYKKKKSDDSTILEESTQTEELEYFTE